MRQVNFIQKYGLLQFNSPFAYNFSDYDLYFDFIAGINSSKSGFQVYQPGFPSPITRFSPASSYLIVKKPGLNVSMILPDLDKPPFIVFTGKYNIFTYPYNTPVDLSKYSDYLNSVLLVNQPGTGFISYQPNFESPFSTFEPGSSYMVVLNGDFVLMNPDSTPTPTPTSSNTPAPTTSPTPTPSVTGTSNPTPTPTFPLPTPTVTPSPNIPSPTPTLTPSATPTNTPTPSYTPSITPSATVTQSRSVTSSITPSVTNTRTPTRTPFSTPNNTPSPTPSKPITTAYALDLGCNSPFYGCKWPFSVISKTTIKNPFNSSAYVRILGSVDDDMWISANSYKRWVRSGGFNPPGPTADAACNAGNFNVTFSVAASETVGLTAFDVLGLCASISYTAYIALYPL